MESARKNGPIAKEIRKDVQKARLGVQKLRTQWQEFEGWKEFDGAVEEIEKLARDVSKISRHALRDIVARFRKFRRAALPPRRTPPPAA